MPVFAGDLARRGREGCYKGSYKSIDGVQPIGLENSKRGLNLRRKRTPASTHEGTVEPFIPIVDRMIENETSFDRIEHYIEEAPLSNDDKSALWLWAWASIPSPDQRREILFGYDLMPAS